MSIRRLGITVQFGIRCQLLSDQCLQACTGAKCLRQAIALLFQFLLLTLDLHFLKFRQVT